VARHAVVIALPADERGPVATELAAAGYEPINIGHPDELDALLANRRDVAVAILDGESDFDLSLEYYGLLHDEGRDIPALMVVSPRAMDRFTANSTKTAINDEYFTRPYSVESLRWRVEAMCIRSQTVDDGSGPIIQTDPLDSGDWSRRATVVAVFNPKGGVGKTTIATNVATTLQVRRRQRVLLIDADTVTGHVTTSLGMDQIRTVADSWQDHADGGEAESFVEVAGAHPSGLRVVALTASPLQIDMLDPERVGDAVSATRRGFDFVIVDLHPSYSLLNQAVFERADRILVPVTPDVPALRAAVQLRDVAIEMGLGDRLAMVVNRANSGVSVADMERTVGMPALALIRSGGLLFVRAANEGRTVIEMFPRERITEDFDALADRLIGTPKAAPPSKAGFRLFSRQKEAIRV
jgi:MinD-like ATPase involved in chromosome partitioning or flagellar assembly